MADGAGSGKNWTTGRSPLAEPGWKHVEPVPMDAFRRADWELLNSQRAPYLAERQADQVLDMLEASKDAPTFGYQVNNYLHCLQTATMVMEAGHDEEDIVVALLHDIGFVVCPDWHGEFAAALLGGYISERNRWMLQRHTIFQQLHIHEYPGHCDTPEDTVAFQNERDRWRGHPHFEWAAEFLERFDQVAISGSRPTAPIEVFRPMVQRIFARPPVPPEVE